MKFIKVYLITAGVFLALDTLWLGVLSKGLYKENLYPVINFSFNLSAAMAFYLIFIAGIVYFAVWPMLLSGTARHALLKGSLLGSLCYATYDLTNMATIEDWPLLIVVIDILWGMFITGMSAYLAFNASKYLKL